MKSTNTHIEIDELIATYLSQGLESEKLSELENWLKASVRSGSQQSVQTKKNDIIKKKHTTGSSTEPAKYLKKRKPSKSYLYINSFMGQLPSHFSVLFPSLPTGPVPNR